MPPIYSGECSEELPQHECDPCPSTESREFGRTRTAGFIFSDYFPDLMVNPISKSLWDAGLLAGKIIIVPESAGEYDPGEPKDLKGYGDRSKTYGPRTMTLKFNDPNLAANYAHYNALGNQTELIPFFRTSSKLRIFDKPATIKAKDPVADDLEAEVTWEVTAEVISVNIPTYHEASNLVNTVFKCSYLNTLLGSLRFSLAPVTQNVANGTDVTFTIAVTGATGSVTYKWQKSTDNGATWVDIGGATGTSYTINDATSANNGRYRAVATDTVGTVNSIAATLTVAAPIAMDTALTFSSSTSDNEFGVAGTVTATDADIKFEFNKIDPRTGTPANMNIKVSSTLQMVVVFQTDYLGAGFKFTDLSGTAHTGVFTNGDVNF